MSTPSPFEVARAIGNQGARGYSQAKDENLIEKIISQTQNDPEAMQKAIGTILSNVAPERQTAAVNYLKSAYESAREKQKEGRQRQAAINEGLTPDLSPAIQLKQYENNLENQRMKQYGLSSQGGQQGQQDQQQGPNGLQGIQPQGQLQGNQQPSVNPENPYERFTIGQLQQMAGDPSKRISEPAKKEIVRRKELNTLSNEKIKLALKRDSKVQEEADKVRDRIPVEESALNGMEMAVKEGDQSFFSGNNFAELTGFEWARDAYGKQFKTGAKTFLINNVTKFGARPNQYIEQQIADSLAKVGTSKEGNLAALAMTRFDVDMKRKYMQMLDEVADEDTYKPGGLAREAQSRMKDYVERKLTDLANDLFKLNNPISDKEIFYYGKDGNIAGSIPKDNVDELPEEYYVK